MPDNNFDELRQALKQAVPGTIERCCGSNEVRTNDSIKARVAVFTYHENADLYVLAHNHLPAIIAALDQARAEAALLRTRLEIVKRVLFLVGENTKIAEPGCENTDDYKSFVEHQKAVEQDLSATESAARWLAARDARMKREGAAEWLEANNERLDAMNRADVEAEVVKLRKGGE